MLFTGSTTIPANTSESDPYTYRIKITKGTLSTVGVYFPWGCAGLVGVQVLHLVSQLVPLSQTEYLIGNDLYVEFNYDYDINVEPLFLTVRAYNVDDTYDHTPLIFIEMYRKSVSTKLRQFLETL